VWPAGVEISSLDHEKAVVDHSKALNMIFMAAPDTLALDSTSWREHATAVQHVL
jgi:hypothetical protein